MKSSDISEEYLVFKGTKIYYSQIEHINWHSEAEEKLFGTTIYAGITLYLVSNRQLLIKAKTSEPHNNRNSVEKLYEQYNKISEKTYNLRLSQYQQQLLNKGYFDIHSIRLFNNGKISTGKKEYNIYEDDLFVEKNDPFTLHVAKRYNTGIKKVIGDWNHMLIDISLDKDIVLPLIIEGYSLRLVEEKEIVRLIPF